MNQQTKTLKVRVKDKHTACLERMAFEVNQIWNAANEETSLWGWILIPEVGYIRNNISAFDLQKQLKGIKKQRGFILPAASVQETIAEHGRKRKQHKKDKLKWRTSGGSRRSLGWIPFKKGQLKWKQGQCWFAGTYYSIWDSDGLSNYDFRSGSFNQDARGRWYLNIVVEVEIQPSTAVGQIGIDLGLKTTASCSDGTTLERQDFYRKSEEKLGKAQRANKKKQVKSIHAKIKHQRADAIHKFTTQLVKENSLIVVGNVSSTAFDRDRNAAKNILRLGHQTLAGGIPFL